MKRLYAESNFVLELVFAQEGSERCETLLEHAVKGDFELVIPSYCLGEPLETLVRRHRDRQDAQDRLQREVRQLRRVSAYRADLSDIDSAVGLFTRSAIEDLDRLQKYYEWIAAVATLIPLDEQIVARSFELRRDFDLAIQDAFVLASIAVDLDGRPNRSWFVTRNTKDFDDPGVRTYLEGRDCRLLTSFGEAEGVILHDR